MRISEFLKLIVRRKQTVISALVICLAAAVLLVAVQPLKYGSFSRLLVSQEFSEGADAYTISQSNNHLSKLFARVVESGSFYEKVVNSGYDIDREYFAREGARKKEIEKWQKTVSAKSLNTGNGIVEIEVYHPSRSQAEQIGEAVNYILKTENREYHGLEEKIFLKTLDAPFVSIRPDKPDILLIFFASAVLALFLAGVYIYYFPEDRYDIRVVPKNGNFPSLRYRRKKDKAKERIKKKAKDRGKEVSSEAETKTENGGISGGKASDEAPVKKRREEDPHKERQDGKEKGREKGDASGKTSAETEPEPISRNKDEAADSERSRREEEAKARILFAQEKGGDRNNDHSPEGSDASEADSVSAGPGTPSPRGEQREENKDRSRGKDVEERGDMSNIFG